MSGNELRQAEENDLRDWLADGAARALAEEEHTAMTTQQTQKHTPGPWRYTPDRDFRWFVYDEDARMAVKVGYRGNRPASEVEANARLIAAAPELLEVAQRIHALNQTSDILGGLGDWLSDVIARATGHEAASETATRCKRCQHTDRGKLLGGICGSCGDDLRMDAIAYEEA